MKVLGIVGDRQGLLVVRAQAVRDRLMAIPGAVLDAKLVEGLIGYEVVSFEEEQGEECLWTVAAVREAQKQHQRDESDYAWIRTEILNHRLGPLRHLPDGDLIEVQIPGIGRGSMHAVNVTVGLVNSLYDQMFPDVVTVPDVVEPELLAEALEAGDRALEMAEPVMYEHRLETFPDSASLEAELADMDPTWKLVGLTVNPGQALIAVFGRKLIR